MMDSVREAAQHFRKRLLKQADVCIDLPVTSDFGTVAITRLEILLERKTTAELALRLIDDPDYLVALDSYDDYAGEPRELREDYKVYRALRHDPMWIKKDGSIFQYSGGYVDIEHTGSGIIWVLNHTDAQIRVESQPLTRPILAVAAI